MLLQIFDYLVSVLKVFFRFGRDIIRNSSTCFYLFFLVYRLFLCYDLSINLEVPIMQEIFDINLFDSYKEDNRREVKKARDGLPVSLWDTYSAFANCYGGVMIV